ncbi:hypothetical protein CCHR01_16826 [Colletotrichum chrysophilum]|uniref:Uncharacterized protein n=1 Tax=Colletotrichum chrysophilum TaxID=1836956 RepID=A0AAD9A3I9_9PEZI|nr:hypothetical protein CCHR01_16826 [Colletotrichum chrysophilum]
MDSFHCGTTTVGSILRRVIANGCSTNWSFLQHVMCQCTANAMDCANSLFGWERLGPRELRPLDCVVCRLRLIVVYR